MDILKLNRTKETFKERIQSHTLGSQEGFFISIDNFEKFSMEKYGKENIIPDLKESTDEQLYDVLQSWINWNSPRAPSTVKIYFSRLKKYLHYMGIKLNEQDVKAELDFKHTVDEDLYGLSLEDIQTIFKQFRYKTKVQYMCQLSGLMRIGEIVQLRKKHLILDKRNIIVKIPSSIAKFNKGRTTFFSKEASNMLRPLLRNMEDDDLLFSTNENSRYAELNSEQILRRTLVKVGLDMKYESTNRFMINTHSFRAYGITKLSRHDPNFAKKIAGQKGYLLQYDRLSDEEKFNLYVKFEDDLTIDNSAKKQAELDNLNKEKSELKKEKVNHELIKNQMNEMKQELDELKYGSTGRKNKYNQGRLDAPDTPEMKLITMGIPLLLELVFPEEKKRKMMKEFEKADLENRQPNLHEIFESKQMDEEQIQFLKKYVNEHSSKKVSSKSINSLKPRLRFRHLEIT